ncbi:MAG: helix-turn-helix transcriptional regulator [Clostridia bacterium]|nr:helix-turn-helix transcriptional regulator [Clostridia bacterium]
MAEHNFSVNERIRICRKQRGLTQTQMSKVLGIKTSTYSQMERKGIITCEVLKVLSEAFGVSPIYLLYGTETENNISPEKPYESRYSFLEDISDAELIILQKSVFYLNRDKRKLIYRYAIDILKNKICIK